MFDDMSAVVVGGYSPQQARNVLRDFIWYLHSSDLMLELRQFNPDSRTFSTIVGGTVVEDWERRATAAIEDFIEYSQQR